MISSNGLIKVVLFERFLRLSILQLSSDVPIQTGTMITRSSIHLREVDQQNGQNMIKKKENSQIVKIVM